MIRIKNGRLKLLIALIGTCVLFIYVVKNRTTLKPAPPYNINYSDDPDEFKYDTRKLLNKSRDALRIIIHQNEINLQQELNADLQYMATQRAETSKAIRKFANQSYKFVENTAPRAFKQTYVILEYTKVFFQPKFCAKSREEIFNSRLEDCEYSNCLYTCDKEAHVRTADALIFHQRDLETEYKLKYKGDFQAWLENTQQMPFKSVEAKLANNANQTWILWNDEATHVDPKFDRLSRLFNWTLSYKSDSEIYEGSYGFFKYNTGVTTGVYYYIDYI